MTGIYPPYGHGDRHSAYGEEPGYGDPGYPDDQRYAGYPGNPGYESPIRSGAHARSNGYPPSTAYDGYQGYPGRPGHQAQDHRVRQDYQGPPDYQAPPDYQTPPDYQAPPDYQGTQGYPAPRGYPAGQGRWGYPDAGRPGLDSGDHWEAADRRGVGTVPPPADRRAGRRRSAKADSPARAAGRPGRRGRTAMIVIGVATVVLALAAVAGWLLARPYLAEWPATLSKPEKLAGLDLSTEPALQQRANEISASLGGDVDADNALAGFYHDPAAEERLVALVGGTAFLLSPETQLDEVFRGTGGDGMSLGEIRDVDAGPFGGVARCASAELQAEGETAVPLSVCAWADHGSLLIGLFFHRPVDESAELLRAIRAEMLQR